VARSASGLGRKCSPGALATDALMPDNGT
jgi:hypothetical protein